MFLAVASVSLEEQLTVCADAYKKQSRKNNAVMKSTCFPTPPRFVSLRNFYSCMEIKA